MMTVLGIKAKKIMACPGSWVWLAEAFVTDKTGKDVFVMVHYYDGEQYTVSSQSLYPFLAEDDDEAEPVAGFLEEYESYKEAKQSAYAEVFAKLRKVIDMLG